MKIVVKNKNEIDYETFNIICPRPSKLFYIDNTNTIKDSGIYINYNNTDMMRIKIFEMIKFIEKENDFQCWLIQ